VRKNLPTVRIYVVTWAHNAYHMLKAMALQYSSVAHSELYGELKDALEKGLVQTYYNCNQMDEIRAFLTSANLVENADYRMCKSMERSMNGLYVRFISTKKDFVDKLRVAIPPTQVAAKPRKQASSISPFWAALGSDDEDDEEEMGDDAEEEMGDDGVIE
jgi:hypothetical protein